MITMTGTVEEKQYFAYPEKAVLILKMSDIERAFIEFRGKRSADTVSFKEGDVVNIEVAFDGRRGKNTKKHYNNLIGRTIKPALKLK